MSLPARLLILCLILSLTSEKSTAQTAFDFDETDHGLSRDPGPKLAKSLIKGRSLQFSGGDQTGFDAPEDWTQHPTHFTAGLWISPDRPQQSGLIQLSDEKGRGWSLDIKPDGSVALSMRNSKAAKFQSFSTPPGILVPGIWTHVAAVVSDTPDESRILINGFLLGRGRLNGQDAPYPNAKVTLGGKGWSGKDSYSGQIDEIRFAPKELNNVEIRDWVEPGRRFATRPRPPENPDDLVPYTPAVQRFGKAGDAPKPLPPFKEGRFELSKNDVVVFTGQTDTVRSRHDGSLESRIAAHFAEVQPTFRNMAWEGDTVYEQWRDLNFGTWLDQLNAVDATVIFCQFGQMEALEGHEKIGEFAEAYGQLLDQFQKRTHRIVLFSPRPFEKPSSPNMPDHRDLNPVVAGYAAAVRDLAKKRGLLFVDLFSPLKDTSGSLTSNGVHLTPEGRETVATMAAESLGIPTAPASQSLIEAIREKNRLWFDNWRPMNWTFAYGDRTTQRFGQPGGGQPALKIEMEDFKPLIHQADETIHQLALGRKAPVRQPEVTEPGPSPSGDHSPEAELASFTIADGFEINLFASEEDGLVKPVQMRWDDQGRLWVSCIPTYPHIEPGMKPGDYILVCEDTDNDGRADKFHRFAEEMFMPMGIEFGNGGVYVSESSELVFLKDNDGDGKADERTILLSGFGTADSHQMINNIERGPDGDLWFTQGHHAYTRVETPWGISRLSKSGVWRFRPTTGRLDGFFNLSAAGLNCQGVTHDDWGQPFHNSAAQSGGFYTLAGSIPTDKSIKYWPLTPNPTRNTGIEFIGTRHMPEELQGLIVWSGFMANTIELRKVLDDASGFRSERLPDLLQSSRRDFRPVNTKIGPDGAIYVCDWYNAIIGHYQASYRDPERDRRHGRVWRITAKDRPKSIHPDLSKASPKDLFVLLRSSDRLVRRNARHRLFDLPARIVLKAAEAWHASLDRKDPQYPHLLYQLSGIYAAHEIIKPSVIEEMINSEDARLRMIGVRYLGRWGSRIDGVLEMLSNAIADEHPRVRLEAIVALSFQADPRAASIMATAIDHPRDRHIDYALSLGIDALKPLWLPALQEDRLTFQKPSHQLFVLEQSGSEDVIEMVRGMLGKSALTKAEEEDLLSLLVRIGKSRDLRYAFENGAQSPVILRALLAEAKVHRKKPSGDLAALLKSSLDSDNEAIQAAAIELAGAWQARKLSSTVEAHLSDASVPDAIRIAAIQAAPGLFGEKTTSILRPIAKESESIAVKRAVIDALGSIHPNNAAVTFASLLSPDYSAAEIGQLVAPVISRKNGSQMLAEVLKKQKPSMEMASLLEQALNRAGHTEAKLMTVVRDAQDISSGIKTDYDAAYVKRIANMATSKGDPARGKAVYQKLGSCTACHKIQGTGGDIGPDMTIVGAGRSPELLIESVVWPNRQIREGYMTTRISTKDGQLLTGYIVEDSADELRLRDIASLQVHSIARSNVTGIEEAGSAMPIGLTAPISDAELADLISYLSSLRE